MNIETELESLTMLAEPEVSNRPPLDLEVLRQSANAACIVAIIALGSGTGLKGS